MALRIHVDTGSPNIDVIYHYLQVADTEERSVLLIYILSVFIASSAASNPRVSISISPTCLYFRTQSTYNSTDILPLRLH